jgi:hypothetical protein
VINIYNIKKKIVSHRILPNGSELRDCGINGSAVVEKTV